MKYELNRKRLNLISKDETLNKLENAAEHFNYVQFGKREFDAFSEISSNTVRKHFGTWNKGLEALCQLLDSKGLQLNSATNPHIIYSDLDLFLEMERIWKCVGQRPSKNEWNLNNPQIAYSTYRRRFGSWENASLKFIEFKEGKNSPNKGIVFDEFQKQLKSTQSEAGQIRAISLKLRLGVLTRDKFKCVFCGRSPAMNPGVTLQIDHIKPFSKGGKSINDNLQTLCQDCNYGKTDQELAETTL